MLSNMLSRLLAVAFFSSLCIAEVQAQTIRGVVLDAETQEPLAGANVVLLLTERGVATGFDGSFSIEADLGLELKISFIGYETEIVTTEKNLRILLKPSLKFEPLIIQAFRANLLILLLKARYIVRKFKKNIKVNNLFFTSIN